MLLKYVVVIYDLLKRIGLVDLNVIDFSSYKYFVIYLEWYMVCFI